MEAFHGVVKELAQHLKLEVPDLNEATAVVTIDDVDILLEWDGRSGGDDLVVFAEIGIVPEECESNAYRAFLEGNLFWSGTGDATIGVNSDSRMAVVAYKTGLSGLTGEALSHLVAGFVNVVETWKTVLQQVIDQGTDSQSATETTAVTAGMLQA